MDVHADCAHFGPIQPLLEVVFSFEEAEIRTVITARYRLAHGLSSEINQFYINKFIYCILSSDGATRYQFEALPRYSSPQNACTPLEKRGRHIVNQLLQFFTSGYVPQGSFNSHNRQMTVCMVCKDTNIKLSYALFFCLMSIPG